MKINLSLYKHKQFEQVEHPPAHSGVFCITYIPLLQLFILDTFIIENKNFCLLNKFLKPAILFQFRQLLFNHAILHPTIRKMTMEMTFININAKRFL